jgi:hypothetical protein
MHCEWLMDPITVVGWSFWNLYTPLDQSFSSKGLSLLIPRHNH